VQRRVALVEQAVNHLRYVIRFRFAGKNGAGRVNRFEREP
jgi:hypothetical protein